MTKIHHESHDHYVYNSCVYLCCACQTLICPQRSSDGSLSQEEESALGFGKVGELQEVVDRQTADLGQMKERMAAMASRISELEEDLDTARKDLIKSEDMNTRLQRDLREVGGQGPLAVFICISMDVLLADKKLLQFAFSVPKTLELF